MTYPLLVLPLLAVAAATALATIRRPRFAPRMAASALAALALVLLTAVFDNAMIALGLFSYPPERLSGLRIGLAPLEDLAYPVAAAFLVPAVSTLIPARRGADPAAAPGAAEAPR